MSKAFHTVYVGEFGDYAVPDEVLSAAERENQGKSLQDRRTRGAKRIERWGRTVDMNKSLSVYLGELIEKQERA